MRQIQGPKDMPWARRTLIDTSRALWGAETGAVPERDYGLIWASREVAGLAAEAATDFPVSSDTYHQVGMALVKLNPNGALVFFPPGVIPDPDIKQSLTQDHHRFPSPGFLIRGRKYPDVSGPVLVIHPIIRTVNGGLLDICDLCMYPTPSGWEWVERTNEVVVSSLIPEETRRQFQVLLDPTADQFGRFATACMLLMAEPGIVKTTAIRPARKDLVRTPSLPEIRCIDVRPMRYEKAERDASGREYKHRWIVRGHWRNQWHPKAQIHMPRWIAPYIKGPEDAPMLTQPKVYVWNR